MMMFYSKEHINEIFETTRESNIAMYHLSELTPVYTPREQDGKIIMESRKLPASD